MPSSEWFTWLLVATAILYVGSSLLVISGRARHDRRCVLLDHLATLGETAQGGSLAPLHHRVAETPLDVLERCLYEMRAPRDVLQASALAVKGRVGESRLARQASWAWSPWRRVAAVRALAFSNSAKAWPILARAVERPDRASVRAAVVTLGHMPQHRSAELLVHALGRVPFGRAQIATFLEAFPTDISSLIGPLLNEPSPVLRAWGATLAARYAGRSPVEARLRALTTDTDPLVRRAAVTSLGAAGCLDSLPAIVERLDDAVPLVRVHAIQAIGQLGLVRLSPVISLKLADRDWSTREAAWRVLEGFGPSAEGDVLARLSEDDGFARDGAAEILRNLGTLERLQALEAAGPSDPGRRAQIDLLDRTGDPTVGGYALSNLPGVWAQVDAALERSDPEPGEPAGDRS